jgi:very-short-patch-repair endonuclease
VLVWDWHDVPGVTNMHVDCTAVHKGGTLRFEIDGRRHWSANGRNRQVEDWRKDGIMNEHGVSLLRLHHEDVPAWTAHIVRFVLNPEAKVVYTPGFWKCLRYESAAGDIRGL